MISVRDFYFNYGRVKGFAGVSTTLTPGHIYGVLGKNGTGKSTLLYNIAGLLFPSSGRISVNGHDPSKRQPAFLQDIFMVPEEFYLPNIPVKAFLKYYSVFYPMFDRDTFHQYMDLFEVPVNSLLQGMSYGQKKKVYISFGVAANTSVLLMDEPTNGLDIISKGQFRKVIASAAADNKILMISSHQIKDLENLIDEVVIINDTSIVLKESLNQVARKLSFKISFDESELTDALYAESVMRGNTLVTRNTEEEESKVDLELFYKATMSDPAKMKMVLK